MKKKLVTVFSLCLFSLGILSGQNKLKIGLDAGYTYSVLEANLSNRIDSKYSGLGGFGANVSGEYLVWSSLFVSTGVSFWQKNYQFERTNGRSGWYTKETNNFLVLPLLVGGYLFNNPYQGKGVWVKIAGGMYTQYWLSRKREGRYPVFTGAQTDGTNIYTTVNENYDFKKNENQLNRWGYGLQGQAQLGYSLNNKFDVYAAYNYQYGLSDNNKTNKDTNKEETTRSYMLSIGLAYRFN